MIENLRSGTVRRICALFVGAMLVTSCDRSRGVDQRPVKADSTAGSMGDSVRNVSTVALRAPPELVENSAAAMSTRQPGVLFTINDSGNEPLLFAIDTTGASRGIWRVLDATNVDWEAVSFGPCVTVGSNGANQPPNCLYIGDTGDNVGAHASHAIYRFPEPTAANSRGTLRAEVMRYAYADQRHDVEAMYVAPNGDIMLITKRPVADRVGRYRPALMFRVSSTGWKTNGITVAQLIDSLPIVPGSLPLRLITDASLSPNAKYLAVRTYTQVYVFATDPNTGIVNHAVAPSVCDIVSLGERQGEGVTWANDRGRLVFTSEGRGVPIELGDCPTP